MNWSHAAALHALRHRGPDGAGDVSAANGQVWLGHRRLSIVDLTNDGRQPMHSEDGSVHMVCNGEIYNFPELRLDLEVRGHRFASRCDNEAIVHAYEEWGDDCVQHLEGMFAFIVWDDRRRRLLAARDRAGIKPLYFWPDRCGLALASEIGALLALNRAKPPVDPSAMAYVMTLGYVPAPLSIWEGIRKLEAGHCLSWTQDDGVRTWEYWAPPRELGPAVDPEEEALAWQALFERCVAEHLQSDVPIGLFLSGGLDSSSLAVSLQALGASVQALTVSFPGHADDESPVARDVARFVGFPHTTIPVQVDDLDALLDTVSAVFDEPQGYSALLTMWEISRAAAQRFKVVLAGDGGDEVLGGYAWYAGAEERITRRSGWRRRVTAWRGRGSLTFEERWAAARSFPQASLLHGHAWRAYPRFLPEEASAILSPTCLKFTDEQMLAPLARHLVPGLPPKRALQRVDLMTFCTDSILAKVDRASMARSLEVRVPFLDRRVVEWSLRRPVTQAEKSSSKPVLRRYLARHGVPDSVLAWPKQGFSIRNWSGYSWEAVRQRIERGYWAREGYWSVDWKAAVEPGVPHWEQRLWNLLMLTRWAEHWLAA